MQEEITVLESGFQGLRTFDDGHFGKSFLEQFLHAVVHLAGPEPNLGLRQVLFQQRQHAGGVGDVANVHRLPGRTQDDARRPAALGKDRAQGGTEGGGEEVTAVHVVGLQLEQSWPVLDILFIAAALPLKNHPFQVVMRAS